MEDLIWASWAFGACWVLLDISGNVWCIVPRGCPRTRTVDVISDVTWTVCYPWACTSSRSRIGTPGIARSSSTPKSWLRDGRNLPPEELCWDIFWPTRDRIPVYLERSRNYHEDCAGRANTAETGRKERESVTRKNVCVWQRERSDLEFWHHWQGSETREVKLYLWSKNCCV